MNAEYVEIEEREMERVRCVLGGGKPRMFTMPYAMQAYIRCTHELVTYRHKTTGEMVLLVRALPPATQRTSRRCPTCPPRR